MKMVYESPRVEIVPQPTEDIISTSITIELPWLPLEEDGSAEL